MYFITEGLLGIGYSLVAKGFDAKEYSIGKKIHAP